MNILPGNLRFGAGQPVKRLEDQRLLTGKGHFIDDKPDDGALWLYVLRSPHAHAKMVVDRHAEQQARCRACRRSIPAPIWCKDNIGTHPDARHFQAPGRLADDGAAAAAARA